MKQCNAKNRSLSVSALMHRSDCCHLQAIASAGFASKGYNMTGSVLDAYVGRAPAGVIDAANAMVLIHLIPAYQVWSQPHYEFVDLIAERSEKWPRWLGKGWVLRLWYRTLYTCFITFLAILLPFFNTIMGFVGAMG